MIGQTKSDAMRNSMGKALGTVKKHAKTGAAVLGGVGLAYIASKARQHTLPGATSHHGSGPGYSHRQPYTDRFGQTWTPGQGGTWTHGNWTAHQHPGQRAWYDPRSGPR